MAKGDGRRWVKQAVTRGATAIISDSPLASDPGVPVVVIPDMESRLGALAASFWNHPSASLNLIAVTGTDGKTSTSQFIARALNALGHSCANIGTLGIGWPGDQHLEGNALTTPDAFTLQRALAHLRDAGARTVTIEASSHGLSQGRLDGASVDAAVLTQLGRDHLDYHGSQEAYAAAKRRLFERQELRSAVLNADDPFSLECQKCLRSSTQQITYSLAGNHKAKIQGRLFHSSARGLFMEVRYRGHTERLRTSIRGSFNAQNLMAALGALLCMDIDFPAAAKALEGVSPVPGRMEIFTSPDKPLVALDYAHTPNGLEQVLRDFRQFVSGSLWCVIGLMGNRDRGKRPLMGAHLARWADCIILTDSMTHGEDPNAIIGDLLRTIPPDKPVRVIHDREAAIAWALDRAKPEDGVLVIGTGKGHERETIELNGRRIRADYACVSERLRLQG